MVVTARLKDGFTWETTDVEGWEFTPALATWVVQLDTPLCAAAIPSSVEVTQSTCEFGIVNPPVILISGNTESVFYTFDGPIEPGATVVITATLEDGFEWDDTTVPGWTFSVSSATYTVVLDPSGCEPADPGLPVITEGSCLDGVLILPSLELPADTAAVTYTRSGNDVPGGTVVITASLNPGYNWSGAPVAGWDYTTPSATYTFRYAQVPCAQVLPVAPLVGLGACFDGEIRGTPTVQLPANTDAVTYSKSGAEVFGGTVVVTATLNIGYSWASTDLAGWEFTSPTTATLTVELTPPVCDETPTPGGDGDPTEPAAGNDGSITRLPSTGTGANEQPIVIGMLAAAMILLLLARLTMIRRTPRGKR